MTLLSSVACLVSYVRVRVLAFSRQGTSETIDGLVRLEGSGLW